MPSPEAVFINDAWKPKKSYSIQMTFEAWLLSLNTNGWFFPNAQTEEGGNQ